MINEHGKLIAFLFTTLNYGDKDLVQKGKGDVKGNARLADLRIRKPKEEFQNDCQSLERLHVMAAAR